MKYKKKRLKDLKERRLKRKKNEQGITFHQIIWLCNNDIIIYFKFITRIKKALTSNENRWIQVMK